MTAEPTPLWPEEIRLSKGKESLFVKFDNGYETTLSAELLRVESPSAEVQGHGVGQKTTPAGKAEVTISALEPVGNYAIRISFSDGHGYGRGCNRGISGAILMPTMGMPTQDDWV